MRGVLLMKEDCKAIMTTQDIGLRNNTLELRGRIYKINV